MRTGTDSAARVCLAPHPKGQHCFPGCGGQGRDAPVCTCCPRLRGCRSPFAPSSSAHTQPQRQGALGDKLPCTKDGGVIGQKGLTRGVRQESSVQGRGWLWGLGSLVTSCGCWCLEVEGGGRDRVAEGGSRERKQQPRVTFSPALISHLFTSGG